MYGAINYRSGQVHYLVHPKKNAAQFHEFLRQLLESHRNRWLVLTLDNATYHLTQKTLDLLAEHADHVQVLWLPKYSPQLNAIEGLWGYLKRSALNNYFFGDVTNLENAVVNAFKVLNKNPNTALSLAYRTSQNLGQTA